MDTTVNTGNLPVILDQSSQTLIDELQYAIAHTDSAQLKAWGKKSRKLMAKAGGRRIAGLGRFIWGASMGTIRECWWLLCAEDRKQHASDRMKIGGAAAGDLLASIGYTIFSDPKTAAIKMGMGAIGFGIASGGFDGDGGIPDTDLIGGPGDHRSLVTHTVAIGILSDAFLESFVELVRMIHRNLPADHNIVWDQITSSTEKGAHYLGLGIGAGLAYHFAIDATLDGGGTYKGLPFSMPQEAHNLVQGANAVAEAGAVSEKVKDNRS